MRSLHSHCHDDIPQEDYLNKTKSRNKLIFACVICILFTIVEVLGGYVADSLAILTDAAHLLTDFGSFIISLLSLYMSWRPATRKHNFGWNRAEVLGAFVSILLIWVVTGVLIYFAVRRIIHNDYEINSRVMLGTACFGVVVNLIMGLVLHPSSHTHHGHGAGHSHNTHYEQLATGEYSPSSNSENSLIQNTKHHLCDNNSTILIDTDNTPLNTPSILITNHDLEEAFGSRRDSHYEKKYPEIDGQTIIVKSPPRKFPRAESLLSTVSSTGSNGILTPLLNPNNGCNKSNRPLAKATHQSSTHLLNAKKINAFSLAVRAAYIHVLGDIVQSIGIMIAAFIIYYRPEYKIADPICTFIFSFFVLLTTFSILKDIVTILMAATPVDIKHDKVKESLLKIPGVKSIHDLRIWALTGEKRLAIFHAVVDIPLDHIGDIQKCATVMLKDRYNLEAINIQCESYDKSMEACQRCNGPL